MHPKQQNWDDLLTEQQLWRIHLLQLRTRRRKRTVTAKGWRRDMYIQRPCFLEKYQHHKEDREKKVKEKKTQTYWEKIQNWISLKSLPRILEKCEFSFMWANLNKQFLSLFPSTSFFSIQTWKTGNKEQHIVKTETTEFHESTPTDK